MEEEAISAEKEGNSAKAKYLREEAQKIRLKSYFKKESSRNQINEVSLGLPSQPTQSAQWNFGFKNNLSSAGFYSGKEWALDSGLIAFQAGSPFFPRSPILYQNQSDYPLSEEEQKYRNYVSWNPYLQYLSANGKWAIEYTTNPYQTDLLFRAYDPQRTPVWSAEQTRFRFRDHRLTVKIFESLSRQSQYSWNFSLRGAEWNSDASRLSPAIGKVRTVSETASFVAPSAGFRYYYAFSESFRLETGGDLFLSPFGSLKYANVSSIGVGSFSETKSNGSLAMNVIGLDLNLGFAFKWANQSLFFGWQAMTLSWIANESRVPFLFATDLESWSRALVSYYNHSGFYEGDGSENRSSRSFSISTLYFGYSYGL